MRVEHYEGLVYKTAQRIAPYVELEFEDIQQELRVKVFSSLRSYDPARSKMPPDRFVFSCVYNRSKDLLKRRRQNLLHIEDFYGRHYNARDEFDSRYLSADEDQAFSGVLDEGVVLPNTLSDEELAVVFLLWHDYSRAEVARHLKIPRRRVDEVLLAVRGKMADRRPSASGAATAPPLAA